MDQKRIVRLVDAHAKRRDRIQTGLLGVILRLLGAMAPDDWYSDEQVSQFAEDSYRAIREAQQQTASLTFEYLTAVLEDMGLKSLARMPDLPDRLRDVAPEVEWSRPAVQYRYAKSVGKTDDEAAAAARQRVELMADADLTAAVQHTTVATLAEFPEVIGYRRVIHPEMAKGGTCGLCIVVADRIYRVDQLLPVHDRCNCGVLPVTDEHDPGSPLNEGDLADLYEAAGGTAGEKLKRLRVVVEDHSELGPRLISAPAEASSTADLADLSDDDLDTEMMAAMERGDDARLSDVEAEMDRRDKEKARQAYLDSIADDYSLESTSTWTDQEFDDALTALASSSDQFAADEIAYLSSIREQVEQLGPQERARLRRASRTRGADRQDRDRATISPSPSSVDEQVRSDYDDYVWTEWERAEEECAGQLLNAAGRAAGISPRSLWSGTAQRARKYASEELKSYWQRNGRLNFTEFRTDALGRRSDRQRAHGTKRDDWYDSTS